MQHRRKNLPKRVSVRREQSIVCTQPDLATPGVWMCAVLHSHAGHPWPVETFPSDLDDVSKPAAKEYLVEIQERFDDQIWVPLMPFTSNVSRL